MPDWATLAPVAIGAASALAGSLGGQLVQGSVEARRDERQAQRDDRGERRTAYLTVLAQAGRMVSAADSAMGRGSVLQLATEFADKFQQSVAAAEMHAPADVWTEMEPYVRAAQLRASAVARQQPDADFMNEVNAQLEALDGFTVEGIDRLRARFVAAARRDVADG